MTQELPTSDIILYIWPGQWGLPSFDPICLATVLELQLAVPGKFHLVQCNTPDASPAGQLPSLIHGRHIITSFRSIVKYVSGLRKSDGTEYPNANVDISLAASQKAQTVAWCAHVESHLGDLVYYMLYSSPENWDGLTRSALSSMFGLPQRYYVPERLRELYRPRLEAAGLWSLPVEDKEEKMYFQQSPQRKKDDKERSFRVAFEKEKVLEKAKSTLDIYARLLDNHKYIFSERPTTVDAILAAHVLVLMKAPYPNPLIKSLIQESYSSLEAHALRVHSDTLRESFTPLPIVGQHSALSSLVPAWPAWRAQGRIEDDDSEETVQWKKMNWAFFGLVLGCFTAYTVIERQALLQNLSLLIRRNDNDEEDGFEEDDEDELEEFEHQDD